jgi:hypothetical protein
MVADDGNVVGGSRYLGGAYFARSLGTTNIDDAQATMPCRDVRGCAIDR